MKEMPMRQADVCRVLVVTHFYILLLAYIMSMKEMPMRQADVCRVLVVTHFYILLLACHVDRERKQRKATQETAQHEGLKNRQGVRESCSGAHFFGGLGIF